VETLVCLCQQADRAAVKSKLDRGRWNLEEEEEEEEEEEAAAGIAGDEEDPEQMEAKAAAQRQVRESEGSQ
jgi:hypothetical protein